MLTTYVQVVNHLSETYAKDGIVEKADTEIVRFTQLTSKSPLKHADVLWMKKLGWSQVYDEYVMNETFQEGIPDSIVD